ncbi:hypothetical protein NX059_011724 [Plenodomus lindquistii]|nr:hypothetical protein NX059_011724 [Plenodomus lindquistii]
MIEDPERSSSGPVPVPAPVPAPVPVPVPGPVPASAPVPVDTAEAANEPCQPSLSLSLSPAPSHATSPLPTSPASRSWLSSVRRPRTSPGPKAPPAFQRTLLADGHDRRDSALASSSSTTTDNETTSSPLGLRKTPSLPAIVVHRHAQSTKSHASRRSLDVHEEHADDDFAGIDTIIPTGSLDDLTSDAQISFSKRGSMMLGGKKANRRSKQMDLLVHGAPPPPQAEQEQAQPSTQQEPPPPTARQDLTPPTAQHLSPRSPSRCVARGRAASHRVLSTDEMALSRKVRTMYQHGNESAVNWDAPDDEVNSTRNSVAYSSSVTDTAAMTSGLAKNEDASSVYSSQHASVIVKEPTEAAGGLEDWADLEGGEVDRYGFIIPQKTRRTNGAFDEGLEGPDEPRIQRVSTTLQLVSNEPRRRTFGRSTSRARSTAPRSQSPRRRASQKSLRQTRSSIFSGQTSATRSSHRPLRHATNILPHNRDRRLRDEASDMLKLPPGLAEVAEQAEGGKAAQAMKAKEIERNEKWRKMAKVVKAGADKGGMLFEFDTKDSKLISRTWKGIPDRWRATAWYSFLAASARADASSPSEQDLIASFYELQEESSAEDVQIDVDVPRTINRHIMFRRRYRGGQRLLFRVLHAMSLYLPDTGYVQGMAALAATLLCYYEEDRAFVMLVRLWMLRGLERLYEAGFAGLMEALEDFEQNWLCGGDVAKQLVSGKEA